MKARNFIFSVILLFSALFAGVAPAATVSVVPGKEIGLSDSFYWAGIVILNIDGREFPAMTIDFAQTLSWDINTASGTWEASLLTYNDIMSGNGGFSPEQYSMAAQVFISGLLALSPPDPLWAAGHNEMIWDITTNPNIWEYGDRIYDPETGITIHDVYIYNYLVAGLDPTFDWSPYMRVVWTGDGGQPAFFVYTSDLIKTPVPPAVWLFGSGLIGLVAVARRQQS